MQANHPTESHKERHKEYRKRSGEALQVKARIRSKRRRQEEKSVEEMERIREQNRNRQRRCRASKKVVDCAVPATTFGSQAAETKALVRYDTMSRLVFPSYFMLTVIVEQRKVYLKTDRNVHALSTV